MKNNNIIVDRLSFLIESIQEETQINKSIMSKDDPWGDVFAMANGSYNNDEPKHQQHNNDSFRKQSSQQQTNSTATSIKVNNEIQRKRKYPATTPTPTTTTTTKINDTSIKQRNQMDEHLMQRCSNNLNIDEIFPVTYQWTKPYYDSKNDTICLGYQQATIKINSINSRYDICIHCQHRRVQHIIQPYNTMNSHWSIQIMCCIYNLRSFAKTKAKTIRLSTSTTSLQEQQNVGTTKNSKSIKKQIKIVQQQLQFVSDTILRDHCIDMIERTNTILNHSSSSKTSNNHHNMAIVNQQHEKKHDALNDESNILLLFEKFIRLIIVCDATYYRLYYLNITGDIQHINNNNNNNKRNINNNVVYQNILHPCMYFQEYIVEEDKVEDGIDCRNVLETIHTLRKIETNELFIESGWYQLPITIQQTLLQVSKFSKIVIEYNKMDCTKHNKKNEMFLQTLETPASLILMEWRNDSCRDYLCHLYSYACISNECIGTISNVLQTQYNIKRIIEIGAGTGYISYLFQKCNNSQQLDVIAYDIVPTTKIDSKSHRTNQGVDVEINEYHGATPSFMPVQNIPNNTKVNKTNKKRKKIKGSNHNVMKQDHISSSLSDSALLLCYPPPQSTMAFDTLRQYTENNDGGINILIHIGEFKGLTGSNEFEDYLLLHFVVQYRYNTLTWGTDCSEITIWMNRRIIINNDNNIIQPKRNDNVLIPCSCCHMNESIKRYQLCRTITYCSKKCFHDHQIKREKNHLVGNIQHADFDNNEYFQELT